MLKAFGAYLINQQLMCNVLEALVVEVGDSTIVVMRMGSSASPTMRCVENRQRRYLMGIWEGSGNGQRTRYPCVP
ncbi:hypothetical protein [Mycobacterium leprae]|uniref:hypothetical protein n=1 Tax=Mycobacterium leprae TaxID=1769 RepID=UPI0002E15B4E|nr:hypothetical protein [Mycobacterium leprae]OAR20880.1 hypothetical protein A8144_09105 [Mycobacterium leprae 3125609]OAX71000.1 hypothetical protein A3216_08655 [Mycobacterium leprae 7935681]